MTVEIRGIYMYVKFINENNTCIPLCFMKVYINNYSDFI